MFSFCYIPQSQQQQFTQDHPNIVRLEEVYESHSEIYLVQEVCKGGELFDRLDEQPDYHYTEAQVSVNWTDRDGGNALEWERRE